MQAKILLFFVKMQRFSSFNKLYVRFFFIFAQYFVISHPIFVIKTIN